MKMAPARRRAESTGAKPHRNNHRPPASVLPNRANRIAPKTDIVDYQQVDHLSLAIVAIWRIAWLALPDPIGQWAQIVSLCVVRQ